MPDIIVVGAGAAGIMAAYRASQLGAKVLLLEKGPRIGTKILISGGGKCNIAHDGPLEDVLRAFRPREARFIRPACYRLTNRQIMEMFTRRGLEIYTREDGRVFPVHQNAKDVVAILGNYLNEVRAAVRLNTPVCKVLQSHGKVTGVETEAGEFSAPTIILSVGGSSYPGTGTTGDGYPWLRELGHKVMPVRAALAPIYLKTDPKWAEKSGIALRDVVLKARQGKEIARWRGDLLFTHHGLSGPCALGITREIAERPGAETTVEVDLTPDRNFDQLSQFFADWCRSNPRKIFGSFLDEFVPDRLVHDLATACGIDSGSVASQMGVKNRNRVIETIKSWRLGAVLTIPLEKGEVVAGGVALDEVDPHTMRSLRCDGLYLCGEILDVAGPVGGYNLQSAFATGYMAGEEAAKALVLNRG